MAVLMSEVYKQKNGVEVLKVILKPTNKFPEGMNYFYAPAETIDLVNHYKWCLFGRAEGGYVSCHSNEETVLFHRKLYEFYHGYVCQEGIDHINQVEFDNVDQNLNVITHQQNSYNCFTKGYASIYSRKCFRAEIKLSRKKYLPFRVTHTEDEACIQQNHIEKVWLKEKLGADYYMFDFLKYRRGSEDILDLERKGIISEEEAIYHHIMKYADNAWYYLRYNLEEYFNDNHIPVPKYDLDTEGFMVDKITRKRLCPFN